MLGVVSIRFELRRIPKKNVLYLARYDYVFCKKQKKHESTNILPPETENTHTSQGFEVAVSTLQRAGNFALVSAKWKPTFSLLSWPFLWFEGSATPNHFEARKLIIYKRRGSYCNDALHSDYDMWCSLLEVKLMYRLQATIWRTFYAGQKLHKKVFIRLCYASITIYEGHKALYPLFTRR